MTTVTSHHPPSPPPTLAYPHHRDASSFADPSQVPPGVLANQQRAREQQAELDAWQRFDRDWQLFQRAWLLNVRHGEQAWRRRYTRPLAPYGLGFLFCQPATGDTSRTTIVTAATRLWLAGPETQEPTQLLAKLAAQVRGRDPQGRWDLREQIANRRDDGMTDAAVYTGLALSTLNTSTGRFPDLCATAGSELDIPGTILYVSARPDAVAEQKVFIAERRGASEHHLMTIHSHHALSTHLMSSPHPYADTSLDNLYHHFGHGPLLHWMLHLDLALHDADSARRIGTPTRRDTRHRLP